VSAGSKGSIPTQTALAVAAPCTAAPLAAPSAAPTAPGAAVLTSSALSSSADAVRAGAAAGRVARAARARARAVLPAASDGTSGGAAGRGAKAAAARRRLNGAHFWWQRLRTSMAPGWVGWWAVMEGGGGGGGGGKAADGAQESLRILQSPYKYSFAYGLPTRISVSGNTGTLWQVSGWWGGGRAAGNRVTIPHSGISIQSRSHGAVLWQQSRDHR
jgi:hypothetical protein